MMSSARMRLAAQAAAAGYSSATLALIAEAALPSYRRGVALDDPQIDHVRTAVEILAQAGLASDSVPPVIAHYVRRYDVAWREQFWHRQLRRACLRFNHPATYGMSPCEAEGSRR